MRHLESFQSFEGRNTEKWLSAYLQETDKLKLKKCSNCEKKSKSVKLRDKKLLCDSCYEKVS